MRVETTETPKITQAIYYHKKLFFNRARLQVQWEEVPEADHYEIRVTKKNGESKIYKDSDTALFVYEGSDDFVQDVHKKRQCRGQGVTERMECIVHGLTKRLSVAIHCINT